MLGVEERDAGGGVGSGEPEVVRKPNLAVTVGGVGDAGDEGVDSGDEGGGTGDEGGGTGGGVGDAGSDG